MTKECVWYNGETGCYELLNFDPNGLSKAEALEKAKECLEEIFHDWESMNQEKVLETLYLIDVDNLENLN